MSDHDANTNEELIASVARSSTVNLSEFKTIIRKLEGELRDSRELIDEIWRQVRFDCFNRHSVEELIELHREHWNENS